MKGQLRDIPFISGHELEPNWPRPTSALHLLNVFMHSHSYIPTGSQRSAIAGYHRTCGEEALQPPSDDFGTRGCQCLYKRLGLYPAKCSGETLACLRTRTKRNEMILAASISLISRAVSSHQSSSQASDVCQLNPSVVDCSR